MQSEVRSKRRQFQEAIRKEFIESYKKRVRNLHRDKLQCPMEGTLLDQPEDRRYFAANFRKQQMWQQNMTEIQHLNMILNLNSMQICTNQNFEFLLASMHNNSMEVSGKHEASDRPQLNFIEAGTARQRINSLVYRILEKVLDFETYVIATSIPSSSSMQEEEAVTRIHTVMSKLADLLEYPQLMPLWNKVSLLPDKQVKQYCSRQLMRVLEGKQLFFDPDFVLQIITNLFVQKPSISFELILGLMKYVSYTINSEERNSCNINRVSLIIRSILQEDGKQKLVKMIEQGYEHVLLVLIDWISVENAAKGSKDEIEDDRYTDGKTECYCLSDKITEIVSPNLVTKLNLIKMINSLFTLNPEISKYLYYKCSSSLFTMIFQQFGRLDNQCGSKRGSTAFFQYHRSLNEQECEPMRLHDDLTANRYKYMLCKSHRMLIRHLLITMQVVLGIKMQGNADTSLGMGDSNSLHGSPLQDFLVYGGLELLVQRVVPLAAKREFMSEVVGLLTILDTETFYKMLRYDRFCLFADILSRSIASLYCYQCNEAQNFTNRGQSQNRTILQLLPITVKILKVVKHMLMVAYARATEPQIFEEVSLKIAGSFETRQFFQKLDSSIDQIEDDSRLLPAANNGRRTTVLFQNIENPVGPNARMSETRNCYSSPRICNAAVYGKLIMEIIKICEQPQQFFKK